MTEHDTAAIRRWLADWGDEVAAVDFAAGARRFDRDVVGFGTKADAVNGIDALRGQQWEHVWPAIADFRFEAADADVWVSPDGLLGVIATAWCSTGRNADGSTFPRNGRATVVVRRDDTSQPWRGCHTHFSLQPLDPGTYLGATP